MLGGVIGAWRREHPDARIDLQSTDSNEAGFSFWAGRMLRPMGKRNDEGRSGYPCLMHPNDLRRVNDPRDEYPITKPHRFRRAVLKLLSAVR